jgi:ATP-dependent Clp protease ATP-binding subunit ClpA
MFERFTGEARAVVSQGIAEAKRLSATAVGPEHLLVAVVDGDPQPFVRADDLRDALAEEDPEAAALAAIGISLAEVRQALEESLGPGALSCEGRLPFTADAKRTLELALREAVALKRGRIGSSELLLGLLRERNPASELLDRLGVDAAAVYERQREALAR